MSIKHLSGLLTSQVERVKLGMEYQVTEWFSEGVEAIASASSFDAYPLDEMAQAFGWETTARILWI